MILKAENITVDSTIYETPEEIAEDLEDWIDSLDNKVAYLMVEKGLDVDTAIHEKNEVITFNSLTEAGRYFVNDFGQIPCIATLILIE